MPSNVVLRNAKSRQANARKTAVASKNRIAQKKRIVASRSRRVSVSNVNVVRPRMTPALRVAAGIAGILLGINAARGAGHPSPTPNPAVRSKVERSQFSLYTQQTVDPRKGFTNWRFVQKTSTNGPVVVFEQKYPNPGKPNYLQVGIAQKVVLPGGLIARLGMRTPEVGKGRIDLGKGNYGVIFARKGVSVDVQRDSEKGTTRYTFEAPVGKSSIDFSYMEPNFLSAGKSTRIGVGKLEKTLGVNLGKLSSSMGITFPKGANAKVDVGVFYPTKFGGAGLNVFEMPSGEKRVSGILVINF